MGVFATIGVTAGAHRLWSHKAYKATWQLRVILMILNSMSFQNSIYEWVRDHRWVNNIQIEKLTGKWYFFCSGCIISTQRRMPIHILSPGNANFYSPQSRNHGLFRSCRGFFFAHMGWLMVKKHPDVKAKGKGIDMSDLEKDEVVMFQKRYERIYI